MSGGGGAVDHARHQRERDAQGSSQARTRRSVTGQVTMYVVLACDESAPIFPPAGRRAGRNGRVRARRSVSLGGWSGITSGAGLLREPGSPAERESATDQLPVAADGAIAAHHEIRPAQFVLDLFVALLDPVAQPIQ